MSGRMRSEAFGQKKRHLRIWDSDGCSKLVLEVDWMDHRVGWGMTESQCKGKYLFGNVCIQKILWVTVKRLFRCLDMYLLSWTEFLRTCHELVACSGKQSADRSSRHPRPTHSMPVFLTSSKSSAECSLLGFKANEEIGTNGNHGFDFQLPIPPWTLSCITLQIALKLLWHCDSGHLLISLRVYVIYKPTWFQLHGCPSVMVKWFQIGFLWGFLRPEKEHSFSAQVQCSDPTFPIPKVWSNDAAGGLANVATQLSAKLRKGDQIAKYTVQEL